MINYNSIDTDKKQALKNQLIKNATSLGGKNHFLSLIEAIRVAHPHPLMDKDASFGYKKGFIKWEKVIFKEKVNLLMMLINDNDSNIIFIPDKSDRNYKTIRNLIMAINPIQFKVRPKNSKDGDGFIFNLIERIDENTCQLSFMFEVLFVLPIKLIKKIYIGPKETI